MKESEELKNEAKKLLSAMFGITEQYTSGVVERIVDCIVGAAVLGVAVLETASLQKEAVQFWDDENKAKEASINLCAESIRVMNLELREDMKKHMLETYKKMVEKGEIYGI